MDGLILTHTVTVLAHITFVAISISARAVPIVTALTKCKIVAIFTNVVIFALIAIKYYLVSAMITACRITMYTCHETTFSRHTLHGIAVVVVALAHVYVHVFKTILTNPVLIVSITSVSGALAANCFRTMIADFTSHVLWS